MQKNEENPFRFSPQVLIILAAVLLALAVPVAMVIYATQEALAARAAPSATEEAPAAEPLREVLEDLAGKRLSAAPLEENRLQVTRTVPDPRIEQARIEALARRVGGTTLPSTDATGTAKILVSVPAEKARAFLQELGAPDPLPPLPDEPARLWVEIVVKEAESP